MTIPSLSQHDLERLSSFLDGQFTVDEGIALQRDLAQRADLREGLEALRQTRAMLQHVPRRKVPRNFMLKPEMVPARRRSVTRPVLSLGLASMLATVFLLLSVVLEFVPLPSFGASAPMAPVMPLAQDAGSGRNLAATASQPTKAAEMSQPAGTLAPTSAPAALPTGVQKAVEPTKPAATPTAPQQMRTTGDIPLQATPAAPLPTKPPTPKMLPTQAPTRPPAATQPAPTEPEVKLVAQPTPESALPDGVDISAPQQARKTLTWLQTLLVVLAASTALAALYLRRKH